MISDKPDDIDLNDESWFKRDEAWLRNEGHVFRPGTADLIAFVGLVAIVFFAGIVTGFFMGKFL